MTWVYKGGDSEKRGTSLRDYIAIIKKKMKFRGLNEVVRWREKGKTVGAVFRNLCSEITQACV